MHSRSIAPIASVSGVADHVIRTWDGTAPVVAMVMTHHSHAYIGLSEQSRYQLCNVCVRVRVCVCVCVCVGRGGRE